MPPGDRLAGSQIAWSLLGATTAPPEQVVDPVRAGLEKGLKSAEIEPQVSLEEAKELVIDALGRVYLESRGRLD